MKCQQCGSDNTTDAKFCKSCGCSFPSQQLFLHSPEDPNQTKTVAYAANVGFVEAIKRFFRYYADFRGRASRSEYWWASLFLALVYITYLLVLTASLAIITLAPEESTYLDFGMILLLGSIILYSLLIIPSLSLTIRRLHDIGRDWTAIFFNLIPWVGSIILLIFTLLPSAPDNRWGAAASSV